MRLTLSSLGVTDVVQNYMSSNDPCMDPARNNPFFGHFAFMNTAHESLCWAEKGINTGAENALLLGTPAQMQALTPGLPVGYDPATGTIDPSNTSGATQQQPQSIAQAIAGDNPPIPDPAAAPPWYCAYLGLGCGDGTLSTLAVVAMLGLGAYIFFGLRSNK
jgi:hypothetical protein